jgi:hypothetical protein
MFGIYVLSFNTYQKQPDWRAILSSQTINCRIFLFPLLLILGFNVNADVIDSYSAGQGPFTVGPGEKIADEDAEVVTDSVLGGFRFGAPGVDDKAEAGSTATMATGGGSFTCALRFPSDDNINNNGGCSTGYDRGEGAAFDLSGSTKFLFDVQDVQGGMSLSVILTDTNMNVSVGYVENVTLGQISVPFDELLPPAQFGGVDLSSIDTIGMVIVNQQGKEGDVTLGEFSTDGAITGSPGLPPGSGGNDIFAEELSGNYWNPDRDGEGCQLTLERGEILFILTCYFYDQGEQLWLIGIGSLVNGQVIFPDMTITNGADYGEDFDADDVIRTSWGSVIMTFSDCNNSELELLPVLLGYEQLTLEMTRIVPVTCGGGGAKGDALPWMGAWFDPARDGEGFQLAVEGDEGSIFVMTWYTYLDGEQVWMIGTGTRTGNQMVFDNMIITSGADYGSEFDADDVIRETFGIITVDFSDCNNFTATVDSLLPEFSDIVLDVTKIIAGICP